MQAQCPHYMVKADGSDGSVMFDTLQAFCRPGFLTQQSGKWIRCLMTLSSPPWRRWSRYKRRCLTRL